MQVRKPDGEGLFRRTRYYQSLIDTDLLMAGMDYDELTDTYIIFICPFPVLDGQRHIYTFRHRCDEDFSVVMPDGATKVFLSTKGALEDVSPDVMAFHNYVDSIISNDDFVQEIDQEIKMVKTIEKERRSYMTYAMKLQEERKEGIKEGILTTVRSMLEDGLSVERVAKIAKLPEEQVMEIRAQIPNLQS
jgi:predicted transposase/invertase (TIGR01784 family)